MPVGAKDKASCLFLKTLIPKYMIKLSRTVWCSYIN